MTKQVSSSEISGKKGALTDSRIKKETCQMKDEIFCSSSYNLAQWRILRSIPVDIAVDDKASLSGGLPGLKSASWLGNGIKSPVAIWSDI